MALAPWPAIQAPKAVPPNDATPKAVPTRGSSALQLRAISTVIFTNCTQFSIILAHRYTHAHVRAVPRVRRSRLRFSLYGSSKAQAVLVLAALLRLALRRAANVSPW